MAHARSATKSTRSNSRIIRPKKANSGVRGVKPGTRRGSYNTSKIPDPLRPKAGSRPPAFSHLSQVPKDLLERAVARSHLVADYVLQGSPRGMLERIARIGARRHQIPECEIPGYQVLYAWARQYREYGLLGLVDRPSPFAGRSRVLTDEQEDLILPGLAAQLGYAGITALLADHTPLDQQAPKSWTVRRATIRMEQRYPHLMTAIRKGTLVLGDSARLALSHGILPGGFRLAADSTVADIWIRIRDEAAPRGWEAVRVALTVIQDLGTRLIVTFNLSLDAVDSGILCGTLLRAVHQEANYPGLVSTGLPFQVALDQGSEHQGQFRKLLDTLQVQVLEGTPNRATGRAPLERAIGSISTEVFKKLRGYSKAQAPFSPYAPAESDAKRSRSRLKYDSPKIEVAVEELLTMEELEREILAWIRAYNERPHPALRASDEELQQVIAIYGGGTDSIRIEEQVA